MVLLVEDPNNHIPVPRSDFWEEVHYRFEEFGLNFLFIPELLSGITPMIADYLFPGYDTPNVEATYNLSVTVPSRPLSGSYGWSGLRHLPVSKATSAGISRSWKSGSRQNDRTLGNGLADPPARPMEPCPWSTKEARSSNGMWEGFKFKNSNEGQNNLKH